MKRSLILSILLVGILLTFPHTTFAQGLEQRIPQWVTINGLQTEGVTVLQNGAVQSANCPSPQPYTSTDGSSSGWACFDTSSGTWLLNALPPQSAGVYPEQVPGYYYGYPAISPYYPYDYYPYGYYAAPGFGFGFGFGRGHEFFEHREHERREHGRSEFGHGRPGIEHGGHGHEGGRRH